MRVILTGNRHAHLPDTAPGKARVWLDDGSCISGDRGAGLRAALALLREHCPGSAAACTHSGWDGVS